MASLAYRAMSAAFGIAMIGVAAVVVIGILALRRTECDTTIGWAVIIALLSIMASCLASHP